MLFVKQKRNKKLELFPGPLTPDKPIVSLATSPVHTASNDVNANELKQAEETFRQAQNLLAGLGPDGKVNNNSFW